jgi:hypothetical protein
MFLRHLGMSRISGRSPSLLSKVLSRHVKFRYCSLVRKVYFLMMQIAPPRNSQNKWGLHGPIDERRGFRQGFVRGAKLNLASPILPLGFGTPFHTGDLSACAL